MTEKIDVFQSLNLKFTRLHQFVDGQIGPKADAVENGRQGLLEIAD